jgi:hypothetical protein
MGGIVSLIMQRYWLAAVWFAVGGAFLVAMGILWAIGRARGRAAGLDEG